MDDDTKIKSTEILESILAAYPASVAKWLELAGAEPNLTIQKHISMMKSGTVKDEVKAKLICQFEDVFIKPLIGMQYNLNVKGSTPFIIETVERKGGGFTRESKPEPDGKGSAKAKEDK